MSTDSQRKSTHRASNGAAAGTPNLAPEETLRQSAQRVDELEDDVTQPAAEAKEQTEEAGHRLAGPLDE